jgi:hypothetical protein
MNRSTLVAPSPAHPSPHTPAPGGVCRSITRAALVNERDQCNAARQVVLKLKTPWRDGTTHLVISPLEFMQRLALPFKRPCLPAFQGHRAIGRFAPADSAQRMSGAGR